MTFTVTLTALTDKAVMTMLTAAQTAASAMGVPQCIVIVDPSAVDLGVLRMRGARVLSLKSARSKAQTAASSGKPSSALPDAVRGAIAAATQGAMTGLAGGLPIRIDGQLLGGIGVGSGSAEQDVAVAQAALAAIGADAL